MIHPSLLQHWVSAYRSVYETERKRDVDMTIRAAELFQNSWKTWSQYPSDINLLYQCIDAIKSARDEENKKSPELRETVLKLIRECS